MALDPTTPRSRRALLTAAAAATVATVAEAVVRPLPVAAAGDDGQPILIGDTFDDAQTQTTLANKANDAIVLYVASNSDSGHGGGKAIVGYSHHGIAVEGSSTTGPGVRGLAVDVTGIGVSGEATGVGGTGVSGTGNTGVAGTTETGYGVYGVAGAGYGVYGESVSGPGVYAQSFSGSALYVSGKAHFSRSGVATVKAGHLSTTVTVSFGLTGKPLCFATLRTFRSGVAVAAVRPNYPSTGKMRIYLNKVVSSAITVSWFVLD